MAYVLLGSEMEFTDGRILLGSEMEFTGWPCSPGVRDDGVHCWPCSPGILDGVHWMARVLLGSEMEFTG